METVSIRKENEPISGDSIYEKMSQVHIQKINENPDKYPTNVCRISHQEFKFNRKQAFYKMFSFEWIEDMEKERIVTEDEYDLLRLRVLLSTIMYQSSLYKLGTVKTLRKVISTKEKELEAKGIDSGRKWIDKNVKERMNK